MPAFAVSKRFQPKFAFNFLFKCLTQPLPPSTQLCQDCQQFFGSEETLGRCSVCYKSYISKHPQQEPSVTSEVSLHSPPESIAQSPAPEQKDKSRCFQCRRKLGLLGIKCKCGLMVCSQHRIDHNCTFDFKAEQQERLSRENPEVSSKSVARL
ncbi:hypothetical protein GEMRC1_003683 [Eukaryota sp. GEM-RC1]